MKRTEKYVLNENEYKIELSTNSIFLLLTPAPSISDIALITNISTSQIIYNPHCEGFGCILTGNKLILNKALSSDTSISDKLMVIVYKTIPMTGYLSDEIKVRDSQGETLREILQQLKESNLYLKLISGEEIGAY